MAVFSVVHVLEGPQTQHDLKSIHKRTRKIKERAEGERKRKGGARRGNGGRQTYLTKRFNFPPLAEEHWEQTRKEYKIIELVA